MLHSFELRCTLLSYAAPYWATLHPTKLCCIKLSYAAPNQSWAAPSELSCILLSYAGPFWATLHPIWAMLHPKMFATPWELRCTLWINCALLSYAAPFWPTLHPTDLRLTLNELRGPPIAALLILPTKYTEKTPRNFKKQNASLQARTRAARGVYLSTWPWTTEALIYNIPRVISHWTSEAKKYKVPCHHSCADPTSDINDSYVEKTPRNVPVWKKIRQSIPQLI